MIVGDNGNIFRLVGATAAPASLQFNYDNYDVDDRGTLRSSRARSQLLDYTPGGPDFNAAAAAATSAPPTRSTASRATTSIYGMTGNDVLFGDGQDDDLIGGYGNDWISGGTGDDGVLGDDGRIFTSRNGTAEPLYGVAAATAQTLHQHAGQRPAGDDQRHRRS